MSQIQSFSAGSGSGSGNVTGPGASTTNDIATFADNSGQVIKDSGFKTSDFLQLAGGTMTGNLELLGMPVAPNDAANKAYVDATASGATFKNATQAATTGPLTVVYFNGVAGVGATLTNAGVQAAFSVDGYNANPLDRILIKDQAVPLQNGIYEVTVVGTGASNWVLTRTTDYDQPAEIITGSVVPVINGLVNANTSWLETNTVVAVGIDPIQFIQFTYNAGTFLQVANNLSDLSNFILARQNLGVEIGVDVEAWSAQLDSLAAVAANGVLCRTAANTITPRTITGGGIINVANGDGVGGNPTITATAGGYPITPYVVGPVGQAGYTTIQAAINAANGAGGGAVFIQPGVYVENLTLFGDIQLVGAVGNSDTNTAGNSVVIQGVHTPPVSGYVSFTNLFFDTATDILNSAAAGTALLVFENCLVKITNGYMFNLPNWTGILALFHIEDDGGGVSNGIVNNTGGGFCFFQNSFVGTGSAKVMTTSGPIVLQNVQINCPWNGGTGTFSLAHCCTFNNGVTMSGNATGDIDLSALYGPIGPAFTMSSSQPFDIVNSIVETGNNPAIDGAGAGALNLLNVTYTSSSVVAGTVNAVSTGVTDLGSIRSNFTNHGLLVGAGTRGIVSQVAPSATAGQVLQSNGVGADPSYSTPTYPSASGAIGKILISDGANNVYSIPTYPNASAAAGKIIISNGTNYVESTPKFPNASAAIGKFIRSDGTDWIASTPTLPVTAGAAGKVLQSDGTNYVESTPKYPSASGGAGKIIISDGTDNVYSTPTYPNSAAGTGTILRADGTNWVATTATYPATTTANQVLYSSATNTVGEITSGIDGVLVSSHVGVPSWLANSGTAGWVLTANTNLPPSWQAPTAGGITGTVGQFNVAVGAAGNTLTSVGPGTAGQVLQSGGNAANPAYSTATYPATAAGTGTFLRADGTNWVASTSTLPNTNAQGDLLIGSASNVWSNLVKDTNATRYIANTGVNNTPQWDLVNVGNGVTGILTETNGGTAQSTYAQGDMLYASGSNTLAKLAKNTTATRYLSNTGTSNNPAWAQINLANGVTGNLPIANRLSAVTAPVAYPYLTLSTDEVIIVDTALARTINLMATPPTGMTYRIKDNVGSAAANNITIVPNAGNIDGAANTKINSNYGSIDLVYNGTQWNIL